MIIKRFFRKKDKEKQKITGWMMELFIDHGIDTSGYISDGQPLMTENCSGSQNPDLPPPVEYYHTATHEPAARSPCPTDTEFIESGLSPLPAEPEFSENAPDLPSTKPERLKPRSSILNCGLDPPYNKDPERMAACKRAFCIRIGPPYSYYRYTSGTDPPVESEVRIRSPAI